MSAFNFNTRPKHPAQLFLWCPTHGHVHSKHELLRRKIVIRKILLRTSYFKINATIIVIIYYSKKLIHNKLGVSVGTDLLLVNLTYFFLVQNAVRAVLLKVFEPQFDILL